MKKEKQVRSYKRRTKSGKTVTVKAHTAKYEAADEKAKEVSKKPGAGKELEERKKKPMQLEIPFDKEEEKKVLDEVKGEEKKSTSKKSEKPAEKKTTKKVRPVGSGTNGPAPKSSTSSMTKSATSSVKRDPTDVEFLARQIAQSRSGSIDAARNKVNNMSDRTYRSWLRSYGVLNDEKGKSKSTKTAGTKSSVTSKPAFTAAEFKEWYRGTGSAADKKVAKALRAQLGRSGYRKFEDEAIDNYTSRGHLSMFKRVSGGSSVGGVKASLKGNVSTSTKGSKPTLSKNMSENRSNASAQMKEYKKQLMSAIKDGNSKKIREARKGYMQAMDDSTFGGSKASKASAERDYQSVVKALSKAGYDEQGYKKRSVGTGTNGPELKKKLISEQYLNSKGFKTFKMPQVGTLYLGKNGKGAYIKFKGKRNIQKADIDDYEDFITGHTVLTKSRSVKTPVKKTAGSSDKMIADSKKTSKKTTAPTTSKRIKMSDRVREKKRKVEERLRKVKESGMSLDEYNRLH